MKKFIMIAVLLSVNIVYGIQNITLNFDHNHGKITLNFDHKSCKVECANCGDDLTDKDIEIICCSAYGPYALYMCPKCAKEFQESCKADLEDNNVKA